jgi:hypothetical protein
MKQADDRYSKDRNLKDLKQHQDERAAKTAEMRNQLTGADRAKDFSQVQQDNRSAAADKGLRTNDPITDQMKFLEGQNGKSASWAMDGDPPKHPVVRAIEAEEAARGLERGKARKATDQAVSAWLTSEKRLREAVPSHEEVDGTEGEGAMASEARKEKEKAKEEANRAGGGPPPRQSGEQTPLPDALANPGLGKAPTQDQVRQQRDHLIGQPGNDNNPKPPADMRNVQVFPGSVKVGQQTNPGPEGDNGNGSSSAGGSLDRGPRPGVVDPPKSDSPGTRNPQQ